MGYEIRLDDKCRIFYSSFPVHLRRYYFEYIRFDGLKQEKTYDITFVTIDHKNQFKVEAFMEDDKYFDTYNEAEAYIFKKFNELKIQIRGDEEELKASWTTYPSRRGRRKKSDK